MIKLRLKLVCWHTPILEMWPELNRRHSSVQNHSVKQSRYRKRESKDNWEIGCHPKIWMLPLKNDSPDAWKDGHFTYWLIGNFQTLFLLNQILHLYKKSVEYSMGPMGSPLSKFGIQATDSAYVVVCMRIMTRMGMQVLDAMADSDFVRCLHSVGCPLPLKEPLRRDWPCNPELTLIAHKFVYPLYVLKNFIKYNWMTFINDGD